LCQLLTLFLWQYTCSPCSTDLTLPIIPVTGLSSVTSHHQFWQLLTLFPWPTPWVLSVAYLVLLILHHHLFFSLAHLVPLTLHHWFCHLFTLFSWPYTTSSVTCSPCCPAFLPPVLSVAYLVLLILHHQCCHLLTLFLWHDTMSSISCSPCSLDLTPPVLSLAHLVPLTLHHQFCHLLALFPWLYTTKLLVEVHEEHCVPTLPTTLHKLDAVIRHILKICMRKGTFVQHISKLKWLRSQPYIV
jgi:hypothetical protein